MSKLRASDRVMRTRLKDWITGDTKRLKYQTGWLFTVDGKPTLTTNLPELYIPDGGQFIQVVYDPKTNRIYYQDGQQLKGDKVHLARKRLDQDDEDYLLSVLRYCQVTLSTEGELRYLNGKPVNSSFSKRTIAFFKQYWVWLLILVTIYWIQLGIHYLI